MSLFYVATTPCFSTDFKCRRTNFSAHVFSTIRETNKAVPYSCTSPQTPLLLLVYLLLLNQQPVSTWFFPQKKKKKKEKHRSESNQVYLNPLFLLPKANLCRFSGSGYSCTPWALRCWRPAKHGAHPWHHLSRCCLVVKQHGKWFNAHVNTYVR